MSSSIVVDMIECGTKRNMESDESRKNVSVRAKSINDDDGMRRC